MKKFSKFCIGVALATSLLAGCGNSSANNSSEKKNTDGEYAGVKLVYWSNWDATEPQGIVIKEAVKEFEEETGAEVDLQFKGRKGIKEGLIPALDANQQIDMIDGVSNKSNYGDRIISLEDIVKEHDYEKNTNPVLMKLVRSYYSDGKLKEIPYQMKASGYLYNKKLFKKAGIKSAPANQEEFNNACMKLEDAGIIPITTDDAYAMQAFGMHLARLIGGDEVKKVVDEGGWNRPEVLKTAQYFANLNKKGYFSKLVGSNVWPTGQNTELATGKAAMYCSGTYVPNETKSIAGEDFEWGFFNYPEVDGGINGEESMVVGCQSFSITSKCKKPEAAFALITKLTRGKWDKKIAEQSLGIPADLENEKWPDQLEDSKPYFDNCTEYFATSGGLENNPDITPALKENLMKLYSGSINAEEFVANMSKAASKA